MLIGILKIAVAIILLAYGITCLYLGVTRQAGGVAQVNMILIPAIFAILLKVSDNFYAYVMDNWETCFMFVLMIFVVGGMLASFSDLELIPGLIHGVGLVVLALWISGLFPQEMIIAIAAFLGKACALTLIPLFIIVVFILGIFG